MIRLAGVGVVVLVYSEGRLRIGGRMGCDYTKGDGSSHSDMGMVTWGRLCEVQRGPARYQCGFVYCLVCRGRGWG